jgi:dienelactone hydrolase
MFRYLGVIGVTGLVILQCIAAQAALVGSEVDYKAAGQTMKGYLVYDDSIEGKRPGILVVHEWWGLNDYARRRADMLAGLGYLAMAVDMYGDGRQADHPEEASKFSAEVNSRMGQARQRFQAGMDQLRQHPLLDEKNIGAIGYCFGGGIVLQMARDGLDLKGVVSFHGELKTSEPTEKGRVKGAILVCSGGSDKFVPQEDVIAFIKEMSDAEVTFQFHSFPGALHSFTNPGADLLAEKFKIPIGYQKKADLESWRDMRNFFNGVFAP